MFVRNTLKTLSLAAAIAVIAGTGPALAQGGGDGSLRVQEPLSEKVAAAQAESVSLGEIFGGRTGEQVAAAGGSDVGQLGDQDSIQHPTHSEFSAEWRNQPQGR